jgi:hypothetical protein
MQTPKYTKPAGKPFIQTKDLTGEVKLDGNRIHSFVISTSNETKEFKVKDGKVLDAFLKFEKYVNSIL